MAADEDDAPSRDAPDAGVDASGDALDADDALDVAGEPDELDAPDDVLDVRDARDAVDADAPLIADACTSPSCALDTCAELLPGSRSGIYYLRGLGGSVWRAYCDVPTDGSRAWTLVMKIDGNQPTFQYDAVHWFTGTRLNDGAVDLSETEAKYEGYNATVFREIRLQTNNPGRGRRDVIITMTPAGEPLPQLSAVMLMRAAAPPTLLRGTSAWHTAFPNATLQSACTRFGFNVRPDPGNNWARVRIGGVGDDDAMCRSPDSWVGVGGYMDNNSCVPMGSTLSAGNASGCDGAPTPRRAAAFVWVWIR